MQIKVLKKIICPLCFNHNLQIEGFDYYDENIIYNGTVICHACRSWFPISERLLELVPLELSDLQGRDSFTKKYRNALDDLSVLDYTGNNSVKGSVDDQLKQQKHFDWYSDNNDQSYSDYEQTPFWKAVDKITFDVWRQKIKPGTWLLDVGCAQGRSTFNVIDMDVQVVGFDISKQMIKHLIARAEKDGYGKRSSFFVADASKIPFRNRVFDFVLIYGVLHHLPDPKSVIAEVDRILKEHGTYFGSENNETILRVFFDILMRLNPLWYEEAGNEPLISGEMFREWARDTSLELDLQTRVFIPPHIFNFAKDNAFKLLRITDSLVNGVPLLKNQGGVILVEGHKNGRSATC